MSTDRFIVFVLPQPGEYVMGRVPAMTRGPDEFGLIELADPVYVARSEGRLQFAPVDAVTSLVCSVAHYVGFGEADELMQRHYEAWLEYRQKPQAFAVEEPEFSET
jgi:hypothetical protein